MLSFAPAGWYLLAPVILLPVLYTGLTSTPRRAAWHGFWFGSGLFLAGTYWIYTSVHIFGQAALWIAFFLMIVLVIIMGLYYALTLWLLCRLCANDAWRLLLVAPAVWTAVEWLRGWFLSGFPWMSLGYGQIDSPLAGFGPVAGVYGVSLTLVAGSAGVLVAMLKRRRLIAVSASVALAPWALGSALQMQDWTEATGRPVRATIVQGGISQDRKWLPEVFRPTLDLYRDATLEDPTNELIVWPEVAIPSSIDRVDAYLDGIQNVLRARGQTLLLGILERDASEGRVYNSVLMLDGTSMQTYRKRHLVPFGEFFPVPDFVREWMRLMSLPHNDLASGAAVQPLLVTRGGEKIAVAICYEDAYGAEQLYALPEATILVNVSNDAWFGDSIAPHQHLEIARMRALEAGRYVVRATNNGVSAFLGPKGELIESGPQFQFVSMTRDVRPMRGSTPYARWGNWPLITLCLLVLAWFGFPLVRKRA